MPGERIAHWYAEQRRALLGALSPGDVVIADRWFWSTLALRAAIHSGPRRDDVDTMDMRCSAEDEADMMGWLRHAVHLSDVLPSVIVNAPRSRAEARMAAVFLDAPDAVLDARLSGRGEPLCPTRYGMRKFYRRATCIDTSTDEARTLVPRLVAWAVEGLRMGALWRRVACAFCGALHDGLMCSACGRAWDRARNNDDGTIIAAMGTGVIWGESSHFVGMKTNSYHLTANV